MYFFMSVCVCVCVCVRVRIGEMMDACLVNGTWESSSRIVFRTSVRSTSFARGVVSSLHGKLVRTYEVASNPTDREHKIVSYRSNLSQMSVGHTPP